MTQAKEIQDLRAAIHNALTTKKYDGLLETVNRYRELKPDDASALQLQQRLERREQDETSTEVLSHDVFLSHSSKDKKIVDVVCETLEQHGIRCWIAPRNISPGTDYGESIIDAISSARVMVVVISSNSNESSQVKREIERAVNKDLTVIPFRIEDLPLSKSLEYYLSTAHWLDAFVYPLNHHLDELVTCLTPLISHPQNNASAPKTQQRLDRRQDVEDRRQPSIPGPSQKDRTASAVGPPPLTTTAPRSGVAVAAKSRMQQIIREATGNFSNARLMIGKHTGVVTINRVNGAIKSFAHRVKQDDILLLWDNSFLENGKSGLVLSNNTLYWKSSMFDVPHAVSYDSITDVTIIAGGTQFSRAELMVNSQRIKIDAWSPEAMDQLGSIIATFLTQVMP